MTVIYTYGKILSNWRLWYAALGAYLQYKPIGGCSMDMLFVSKLLLMWGAIAVVVALIGAGVFSLLNQQLPTPLILMLGSGNIATLLIFGLGSLTREGSNGG